MLAWNVDDTLLVECTSDGLVHVLDARARLQHALPPHVWTRTPTAAAAAAGGAPSLHGGVGSDEHASDGSDADAPASGGPPALLDVAWREPLGAKGLSSELLLLGSDARVRRVRIPSTASAAVHGKRAAAPVCRPPIDLRAYHPLVTCLAFDQASGLLAVGGGGGGLSRQAELLLLKLPPEVEPPTPLVGLSLWALTDTVPHATLLFASSATATRATFTTFHRLSFHFESPSWVISESAERP